MGDERLRGDPRPFECVAARDGSRERVRGLTKVQLRVFLTGKSLTSKLIPKHPFTHLVQKISRIRRTPSFGTDYTDCRPYLCSSLSSLI